MGGAIWVASMSGLTFWKSWDQMGWWLDGRMARRDAAQIYVSEKMTRPGEGLGGEPNVRSVSEGCATPTESSLARSALAEIAQPLSKKQSRLQNSVEQR